MTIVKDQTKALALHQEVRALLEKGAIESLEQHLQNSGFYSKKKGGRLRPYWI